MKNSKAETLPDGTREKADTALKFSAVKNTFVDDNSPAGSAKILALAPLLEREIIGAIKALTMMNALTKTMAAVQLCKLHDLYTQGGKIPEWLERDYGSNFKGCCRTIGIPYSTARLMVRDVHVYGQEMLQTVEALNLPISVLRKADILPEEKRSEVYRYLMSGDADREAVKAYIAELVAENRRLSRTVAIDLAEENEQLKAKLDLQRKTNVELKKEREIRLREIEKMSSAWEVRRLEQTLIGLRYTYHQLKREHPEIGDQLRDFEAILTEFYDEI